MERQLANTQRHKERSQRLLQIILSDHHGQHAVLALQTDNLGDYFGVNHKMAMKFAAHFGLSPDDILCTSSKPIDVLLGLDAAALLLDKVVKLNGRSIKPASWAPNIFLYGSPATTKFSLVGRMNIHYPVDNIQDRYTAHGIFYFADQSKYVSCEHLLQTGLYTHHLETGNAVVSYSEPPVRQSKQEMCSSKMTC